MRSYFGVVFSPLVWFAKAIWKPLMWLAIAAAVIVAVGALTFVVWKGLLFGWNLVSPESSSVPAVAIATVEPTTMPTATVMPTATIESTAEPTAVKAQAKTKSVAAPAKAAAAPVATAVPTIMPTAFPIQEGAPNACGYSQPLGWVTSRSGMSGVGETRPADIEVGTGEIAMIWGTQIDGRGRILIVQKGPYKGTRLIKDGAWRAGRLADMSDSGIAAAVAHTDAWLKCSYGANDWLVPEWAPAQP